MEQVIIVLTAFLLFQCQNIKGRRYQDYKALRMQISPAVLLLILTAGAGVVICPLAIAPVCQGDQLELTCTVTGRFLEWSFFLIPEGETTARRYVRSLGPNARVSTLEVNSITFTFSVSSSGSTESSLTSRLHIIPTNASLNGTEVNCTNVDTSNSTSTIVTIINESNYDSEFRSRIMGAA